MNDRRVQAVADAIAALGYDGIAAFDRAEPEYETFRTLQGAYSSDRHVAVLGIASGICDFQLAGDAQRFWSTLESTALDHGSIGSSDDVAAIVDAFMTEPVNARFNSMKRERVEKLFERGFIDWFVDEGYEGSSMVVWEELTAALDGRKSQKTVVFAMKVYDLITLLQTGSYLELPVDLPIPCDLQVKRIARTAGIVDTDESQAVMRAWAAVMERVNEQLGKPVSMLRIDSIVWQAGQVVSASREEAEESRQALEEHFAHVGLTADEAVALSRELTAALLETD